MDTKELIRGLKNRDTDAYLYLTQTYGWKLYSHLSAKLEDPERTNQVFNEAMSGFYNALAGQESDDPVEAILYAYGDLLSTSKDTGAAATELPKAPLRKKRSNALGYWIAAGLLMVGILAALWVIAGLLMDMGYLPELDLGYSWFLEVISGWF